MRFLRASRIGQSAFTVVTLCVACGNSSVVGAAGDDLPQLEVLLTRLSRVAQLYRDNALRFACEEKVVYYTDSRRKTDRFAYIYSVGPDGALLDYRASRRGGQALEESLEPVGVPEYVIRAYSWMFLFATTVQPGYTFEILGREKMLGMQAIRLRLEPIRPVVKGVNDWHASVWIDGQTHQLLRAEGMTHEDHEVHKRLMAYLKEPLPEELRDPGPKRYSFSRVRTEFGKEEHGMRFPSKVVVTRDTYRVKPGIYWKKVKRFRDHKVVQTYKNYKFFSVRTREEILRLVNPDDPGP